MTQAEIFNNFMRAVWENDIRDADGNDLYDTYADANAVAHAMDARPGPIRSHADDEDWREYLFPDGSTIGVYVNGSGISSNVGVGQVFA